MFSGFFRKAAKPKPRTRAERRQAILQRLRAKHPDWSDAKLLHYAATFAARPVVSERAQARARWQADVAAAVADGGTLLARVNANLADAAYRITVPLADTFAMQASVAEFQSMQRDLAEEGEHEKLADLNAIAREHGLPEVQ